MAQIIDQIVKISIQDAISSVTTVDVNTVALVGRIGEGVARSLEVTPALAGDATGAEGGGSVSVTIGEDTFSVNTTENETVAAIVAALVSAINAAGTGSDTYTATNGSSKVTLAANAAGYDDTAVSVASTDANVTVSVKETVAGVGTSEAFETASADRVKELCGADSELYAMAATFFAQDSQPSRVVCIPLENGAANASALNAVKTAAASFDFYHVVVASNDAAFAKSLLADSASGFQAWLADVKKVAHVQVSDATDLKNHGCDRVAVYQHAETQGTGREFLNVAIVALRCASDSARGTFAHKKCKGVTPDSYTVDQYNAWIDGGVNIYVKVSGEARLFMGTTSSNENFIDQVVKDDWIRFNVQSRIYKLLGEGNDGNGVNYDDAGIGAVAASVLNVLTVAQDTDHQYVMTDSASVDYKPYSYLVENYAEDVRKRNLPLITGRYARMNSIHTVVQVSLYVTL